MNAEERFRGYCQIADSLFKAQSAWQALKGTQRRAPPNLAQVIQVAMDQLDTNSTSLRQAEQEVLNEAIRNDDPWMRSGDTCPSPAPMEGMGAIGRRAVTMGAAVPVWASILIVTAAVTGSVALILYSWREFLEHTSGANAKSASLKQAAQAWEACNAAARTPEALAACNEDYRLTLTNQSRLIEAKPGQADSGIGLTGAVVVIGAIAAAALVATRD